MFTIFRTGGVYNNKDSQTYPGGRTSFSKRAKRENNKWEGGPEKV